SPICRFRDVPLANLRPNIVPRLFGSSSAVLSCLVRGGLVGSEVDNEIEANLRQFQGDASANTTRGAGHEGGFVLTDLVPVFGGSAHPGRSLVRLSVLSSNLFHACAAL